MATIITQYGGNDKLRREKILRLKKEQLSSIPLEEIEIKHYKGEKKPIMPKQYSTIEVLSLKVLP